MNPKTIRLLVALLVLTPNFRRDCSAEDRLPIDSSLVALDTGEGEKLLMNCRYRSDFIKLIIYFENQENLGYCGPATAAMVMNALRIERPASAAHGSFRLFTQKSVFSDAARAIKNPEAVAQTGLSLEQFARFLSAQGADVESTYASDSTIDDFRKVLRRVLADEGNFLVVNYLRKEISQESGGHISPIGAFDEATDRILILDVSRYKYPPVWVKTESIWRAMATIDQDSQKSRGFVIVSRKG